VATADHFTEVAVMIFTLLGIYLVSRAFVDRTAMKAHPRRIRADFPDQSYEKKLLKLSAVLAQRLSFLDIETQWDDEFFAPLEAEVEISTASSRRKKLVDLMRALRSEQDAQIILVLGDPGAGKSVALRKLAKDLLAEVRSTGRLPVYVNLKEWAAARSWSETDPPTASDLSAFILSRLRGISVAVDDFLAKYFDRMLDRGRFFFILDSFDEIPAVLDTGEASWLISSLSRALADFFISQDAGRGVVSSRFYRRPKLPGNSVATLEIRPFSDARIYEALTRSGKLSKSTVDELFTSRSELVPTARNPFAAALLRMYAELNGGALPANQIHMYESYVASRLGVSADKMFEYSLSAQDVIAGATQVAWAMFGAADVGLEAPLGRLEQLLPHVNVRAVAIVLRFASLARLSEAADPKFSFVHRRISEYFVARHLMENPSVVALQAIPTDSRYRDALALYCEIGEDKNVGSIADFCWSEIIRVEKLGSAASGADGLVSVHCLRFLRDAFGTRLEMIRFRQELANYVIGKIRPEGDLLAAKLALEASGLLEAASANSVFIAAMDSGNAWLSDASLRACRNIKDIDLGLESRLREYLGGFGILQVLGRADEVSFSLSLSYAFAKLRRFWAVRVFECRLVVVLFFICSVMNPVVAGMIAFVGVIELLTGATDRAMESLLRVQLAVITVLPFALAILPKGRANLVVSATNGLWWHPGMGAYLTHPAITAICYMLVAVGLSPWLDWVQFPRRRAAPLRGVVPGIFIAVCVEYLLPWLQSIVPMVMKILWICYESFLGLCIVGILAVAVYVLVELLGDRGRFRHATQAASVSREVIAKDFVAFRTALYRGRYVEWLATLPTSPTGAWPGLVRPNINANRSSTLLAQLDEKWLGLDA
jgi:hypothetical protein